MVGDKKVIQSQLLIDIAVLNETARNPNINTLIEFSSTFHFVHVIKKVVNRLHQNGSYVTVIRIISEAHPWYTVLV